MSAPDQPKSIALKFSVTITVHTDGSATVEEFCNRFDPYANTYWYDACREIEHRLQPLIKAKAAEALHQSEVR